MGHERSQQEICGNVIGCEQDILTNDSLRLRWYSKVPWDDDAVDLAHEATHSGWIYHLHRKSTIRAMVVVSSLWLRVF